MLASHVGVLIMVAAAVLTSEQFVPNTCSGITAVDIIKVVSIAAKSVAQFGLASKCDGFSARDKHQVGVARE